MDEEMLAKVGFGGDEEFDFLTKVALVDASPECNDMLRMLMDREMKRIYRDRSGKNFQGDTSPAPDPQAHMHADASGDKRRAGPSRSSDSWLKWTASSNLK